MKKFTILSLATVALIFSACGDKEKTTEAAVEAPAATETAAPAAGEDAGKAAFAACAACHGADGKLAALGKSAIIAGQASADLVTKMKGYKAGTIDLTGNGMLMKGQMANLDDAKMEALAAYISKL
jgi:cytochrome c oxidase subunit 2